MSAAVEGLGLYNHEAEIAALAAMRNDTTVAVEMVDRLEASEFYDTRRQVIFEAMANLLRGFETIDTAAILAECRRVTEIRGLHVHVLAEDVDSLTGDVQRIGLYINTIKRLAWMRGAGEFAFWMVQSLQTRPDPGELFTEAQERWQQLAPRSANTNFVYGWDTMQLHSDELRERITAEEQQTVKRLDWPWRSWNNIIRPLRAGMVGIVAAPDGMGKTTYLEQVAEHWALSGHNVVYVHLEDALDYKLDRRLARHSLVAINDIEDGRLTSDQLAKVQDANGRVAKWAERLHYYHAAGESMQTILRELESKVGEGLCDAVVFDYLDKVQPSRSQAKLFGDNGWERQANDMEALKTFAERQSVPVLTATQGNKSMQAGGTQTRRAIQGSGQKSQKAQLVVILTREIVGEAGLKDKLGAVIAEAGEYSPIVNVRIDKQNRGRTGGFQQYLAGAYFTVRDVSK